MAFGIKKEELIAWKTNVSNGNIAYLTHYWQDERFPHCQTVTKVGCRDLALLKKWGRKYNLQPEWIHYHKKYPHYDLFGQLQVKILIKEGKWEHIRRFNLKKGVK